MLVPFFPPLEVDTSSWYEGAAARAVSDVTRSALASAPLQAPLPATGEPPAGVKVDAAALGPAGLAGPADDAGPEAPLHAARTAANTVVPMTRICGNDLFAYRIGMPVSLD
jgi:hypothetical protein